MSDALGASIPPGWYDDPAGSGLQRWWSGIGWTEHTHDPAPKPVAPTPSPADDFGYTGGYKPMSATPGYDQVVVATGPVGKASGNTFGVWAIALSSIWYWLLFIGAGLYLVASGMYSGVMPSAGVETIPGVIPVELATYGVYIVLLFVFAWRDGVALRKRGIAAPSPLWLLLTQFGYLIRRRVVLKRDGVRSNAPGNVFAIPIILAIIATISTRAILAANPGLLSGVSSSTVIASLQRSAASQLNAQTGTTWTVTCPPTAPTTTPGATFLCTATDISGRTAQLQATVTTPDRFALAIVSPTSKQTP
ncbi:MAG: hypothetical protein JWN36_3200 [Microbacteriaceae bacterium]|nr:hypothetical protein [Microbacteriaceae bacterium]